MKLFYIRRVQSAGPVYDAGVVIATLADALVSFCTAGIVGMCAGPLMMERSNKRQYDQWLVEKMKDPAFRREQAEAKEAMQRITDDIKTLLAERGVEHEIEVSTEHPDSLR